MIISLHTTEIQRKGHFKEKQTLHVYIQNGPKAKTKDYC